MYFPMSEMNINFHRQVPWTPVIWNSEIQNMESYGTSCFSVTIKVSEYPSMLKELIYTYFYNISLKLLRLTCFNIYNLPILRFLNIWKTRVKVGSKTNYFLYFMSSSTNRIPVFSNFFSLMGSQPSNKRNYASDFLLFKYFLNNSLLTVITQNTLSDLIELFQ